MFKCIYSKLISKEPSGSESEEIKNLEEEFASEEVGTKSEDLPQWEKELQDELQVRTILTTNLY